MPWGSVACVILKVRRLSTATGMVWLTVGLVASAAVYALWVAAPDVWNQWVAKGGPDSGSLIWSAWEALICVGLSVGLIVLFREVFNRTNKVLLAMAAASYAAYILHLLLVVGLQMGIEGLDWSALTKFGLVTFLGVTLAFGIGYLSQRVPGLRVVLGTKPDEATTKDRQTAAVSEQR